MNERGRGDAADADRAEPADYRIAVAVDNPETVEQLLRTAIDLARDNDGEVMVGSVIVKPAASPTALLTDEVIKRDFAGERRAILDRALAIAEGSGVPVDGRLLVASDVSRALRTLVADEDCNALILGWRERRRREFVFGRNVDRVATRAPCDILVERIGPTANGVESILLPAGDGPNAALAAETVRAIALSNDARIDVVRVIDPDATDRDRAAARRLLAETSERFAPATDVETRLVESDDAAAALVEAAETRDIAVLGATERSRLRRLVVGPTPQTVGRDAKSTVIITKRGRGVRTWVGGWLRSLVA